MINGLMHKSNYTCKKYEFINTIVKIVNSTFIKIIVKYL